MILSNGKRKVVAVRLLSKGEFLCMDGGEETVLDQETIDKFWWDDDKTKDKNFCKLYDLLNT